LAKVVSLKYHSIRWIQSWDWSWNFATGGKQQVKNTERRTQRKTTEGRDLPFPRQRRPCSSSFFCWLENEY